MFLRLLNSIFNKKYASIANTDSAPQQLLDYLRQQAGGLSAEHVRWLVTENFIEVGSAPKYE
jgi:hypothetical protein